MLFFYSLFVTTGYFQLETSIIHVSPEYLIHIGMKEQIYIAMLKFILVCNPFWIS